MTNEQMIRELRAVAEKHRGKQTYTFDTNINLMATDTANRIESLCDEINRQKEEIERLQSMNQAKLDMIHDLQAEIGKLENDLAISKKETRRYAAQCQTIRSETAKELAERLEETAMGKLAWDAYDEEICGFVTVDEIDNFVKEFMKIEVKNNV